MLTKKQNLIETMKGGNPDRFVNQFEFIDLILEAPMHTYISIASPGTTVKDGWGITFTWPEGQIGAFPVQDDEHRVLKDITEWKTYVKAPSVEFSEAEWAPAIAHANSIDRDEQFAGVFIAPGIFEMTHHLMGMEDAMADLYEEPELMHELIDYLVEYELGYARQLIDHLHPNAIFHHDDWGSQTSSFLSPEMFREFLLPAYKRVYGFWKDNGVELIVHHSDSYAANLVPSMIEMGIDIWQGVMTSNDIPKLIGQYGGQLTFMGGINSGEVDRPGWSREEIAEHVREACHANGKLHFIPNLTQGGNYGSFPGVYDTASEEIEKMSKEMF